MSEQEDPKALSVLFVGLFGAVAVFLVVVLLQIVFYRMQEMETARKVVSMAPEELATLRAQQQARLNGYGWVDEGAGVARIPVERAMELVAEELPGPETRRDRSEVLLADPDLAALLEGVLAKAGAGGGSGSEADGPPTESETESETGSEPEPEPESGSEGGAGHP